MSELYVRQYLHNDGSGLTWSYDKSEADKVIADKDKEIVIAHHKYKRCLAMANVCAEKLYRQNLTIYGYKFYCKWLRRWLAIAAKFKEGRR